MKQPGLVVAFLLPVLSLMVPNSAAAQQEPELLSVFLDCNFCDFNHFRREVAFVNYVRDRVDADVHVLGTSEDAGSGRSYTFNFIGLGEYAGTDDTLAIVSSSTDTPDERRNSQVRLLRLGLIQYAVAGGIIEGLDVMYSVGSAAEERASEVSDPWNSWVFRISGNASARGESQQKEWSLFGSVNARRVTEDWKIWIEVDGFRSRSVFDLSDGTQFVDNSSSYEWEAQVVRSVAAQWSTGLRAEFGSSTFSNQDFRALARAAMEYSVFPYEESTRRQLTITYLIGPSYLEYETITIFDELSETRFQQALEIGYSVRQPWGNLRMGGRASNYLHDFGLHRLGISGGGSFRIIRGLNFNLNGDVARIKDQISLPREDIPDEEILVQRRQRGTNFRYRIFGGLSFSFGSIFNSVVNTRLEDF